MTLGILKAEGLVAGYGSHTVLRGIEIAIGKSELCGIIGPNGAGKTTLLRTLYGLVAAREGSVFFDDAEITHRSVGDRLRAGIAYVPQERNVFPWLTVEDNIQLALDILPNSGGASNNERKEMVYQLFPRLAERRKQLVGLMSGGEQRMVAISLGLVMKPRLLLLDEPTTGLAPVVVHQLLDAIRAFNANENIATVIVEQNVLSLIEIVDTLYVVRDGHSLRHDGKPSDLRDKNIWEFL